MSNATSPAEIQIRSDIVRWIDENDGPRGLRALDSTRLRALVDSLLADGPVTSTTVWYLITAGGTDVRLINQTLRELVP